MSDVQYEHINNTCGPAKLHKQYEYIAAWTAYNVIKLICSFCTGVVQVQTSQLVFHTKAIVLSQERYLSTSILDVKSPLFSLQKLLPHILELRIKLALTTLIVRMQMMKKRKRSLMVMILHLWYVTTCNNVHYMLQ